MILIVAIFIFYYKPLNVFLTCVLRMTTHDYTCVSMMTDITCQHRGLIFHHFSLFLTENRPHVFIKQAHREILLYACMCKIPIQLYTLVRYLLRLYFNLHVWFQGVRYDLSLFSSTQLLLMLLIFRKSIILIWSLGNLSDWKVLALV